MSFLCALFAALLPAASCPVQPPPIVTQLGEAVFLRPQVEQAIEVANESLEIAGKKTRLVSSWTLNGRGLAENEISVYLVKSPVEPVILAKRRMELNDTISHIRADHEGISEEAENCDDTDECVERLYPETTVNLVLQVLDQQNAWELAKNSPQCRCVLLIESDLEFFEAVFGADWDEYILLTRFENGEELKAALDENRIPDALLDGKTVPLPAMVSLLLLHEVGHVSTDVTEWPPQINDRVQEFLGTLSTEKLEEIRADAFVAQILAKRCFGLNPSGVAKELCMTPPTLALLTFVVGMKGKSVSARCLRYFDTVPGYPNWQARLLLMTYLYTPTSVGGQSNVEKYVDTRKKLLANPDITANPACGRAVSLSKIR